MVERRHEILGEDLRMVEHVLDLSHGRARHALAENLLPFERGAGGERGADFRHEFGGVLGAAAHRDAARIACQLRAADQIAQRGEEMVRVDRDIERALFCRMDAGQPAGAGIAGHVAPLALGPDKAAGLDRQGAAQQ